MKWINDVIIGLYELYQTTNPYELCDYLNIDIVKVEKDYFLLMGNPAVYVRDYNGKESIFVRNDLQYKEEQYYISHELGHAILHPNIKNSFNKHLINYGKIEKQADSFAFKLLSIKFDEVYMNEMTLEQIASTLELPIRAIKQLV